MLSTTWKLPDDVVIISDNTTVALSIIILLLSKQCNFKVKLWELERSKPSQLERLSKFQPIFHEER